MATPPWTCLILSKKNHPVWFFFFSIWRKRILWLTEKWLKAVCSTLRFLGKNGHQKDSKLGYKSWGFKKKLVDYYSLYYIIITIFVLLTVVPTENSIIFETFCMELGDKLLVSDYLGLYLSSIPWICDPG